MTSRKTIVTLATFATLSLTAIAQAVDNYTIDPTHTSIIFSVGHAGLSYTYGMFRKAAGDYSIDEVNQANSQFRIVIQAESLFTNDAKRDTHLRSADFFHVQQFPTIEFQSTACTMTETPETGRVYELTGNFTMHGVTRQIKVPLRMLAKGLGPYKDQRTGFLCQLELKRSEFGLKKWLENDLVGDAVSVTISFEGFLKAAGNLQSSTR